MTWPATTIVAPLWQGSSRMTAAEATVGARAVADAVAGTEVVEVPAPRLVRGRAAVDRMDGLLSEALTRVPDDDPVLLVGGDCSVDRALLRRSLSRGCEVVWFDAHADANTPTSSPSGAPHGMIARDALDGEPARLSYVGTRVLDEEERRWVQSSAIPVLPVDAPSGDLLALLDPSRGIHVHVDLDVLDPGSFGGLGFPEEAGMAPSQLADLLGVLLATRRVAALTIAEHVPGATQQRDRDVLRRLAAAIG